MKNRKQAAAFIERQIDNDSRDREYKNYRHHYGRQDLRELLDYIYEGEPESKKEEISGGSNI